MKQGLRLKLKEKMKIKAMGFDPKFFLRIKKTAEFYEFIEITSGKILTIRR